MQSADMHVNASKLLVNSWYIYYILLVQHINIYNKKYTLTQTHWHDSRMNYSMQLGTTVMSNGNTYFTA